MSETQILNKARRLIFEGHKEKAAVLLWKLYASKNPSIKLDAILSLLEVLDAVTENEKLLEITNIGIEISAKLGKDDVRAFLFGKKGRFLLYKLGLLIYRQRNLMLSASVFTWIDFSLEKDKNEFEAIGLKRGEIEKEVLEIETKLLKLVEASADHNFRGHIFWAIGDFYIAKYFNYKTDQIKAGKIKSKIANIYFVKRWNLDKFLYDKEIRQKIRDSGKKCIVYCRKSIAEFEIGNKGPETAYASYNLANNLRSMNHFFQAKKYLIKAKKLAEAHNQKPLLAQIELFEKRLADKNRNIRNYVEEFGLDLP